MRTLVAAVGVVSVLAVPVTAQPGGAASDPPANVKKVVRAWSARLNANDNAGAARLFSLPAIMSQGPYGYRLKTVEQLTIWHDGLPCGGTITRIVVRGRFATAVFMLRERKGHKCDAPGTEAAARFEITRGKIRSWTQVAVPAPAGQSA